PAEVHDVVEAGAAVVPRRRSVRGGAKIDHRLLASRPGAGRALGGRERRQREKDRVLVELADETIGARAGSVSGRSAAWAKRSTAPARLPLRRAAPAAGGETLAGRGAAGLAAWTWA